MSEVCSFSAVVAERLTARLWTNLLKGRIGILRLPQFVSPWRCASALVELNDDRFVAYDPVEEFGGNDPLSHVQIRADYLAGSTPKEPPVSRRLGRTLYENVTRGAVKDYFEHANKFEALRRQVFFSGGDIIDEILEMIHIVTGAPSAVAEEPGHGRCFAGVIREVHGLSRLHSDDAREETPDFAVGTLPHQLGMYVFLDMPEGGGALTVYEREYRPEDRRFRQGYGLDPRAVVGDSFVGAVPRPGDLILFPARHIHRVDACSGSGRRIMLQAYLGVREGGDIVCWS